MDPFALTPPWQTLAGALLIEAAVVLAAVLVFYRNRPKPKWLRREIAVAVWIARLLRIVRKVRAVVRVRPR